MPGPRRGEAAPARPTAWRASRKQLLKTGQQSRQQRTGAASTRKLQARLRRRARHAMRSGIAGRADAGAQAWQINATPTPATALPTIQDHGAPRPARQTGPQLARSHSGQDASHDAGRAGAASPRQELGKWMPRPRLGDAAPARPAAWRAPRRRWLETGLRRPQTGLPWPENGSSITGTHRATCPSTPGNFAGLPGTVAGDGPLAGRKSAPRRPESRVIDNGNTSGHVPQHAQQLCRHPGDGGRRRVSPRPEIGSLAGRKSGLRYRVYVGPSASPTFFPDQATVRCTPTPAAGPWAPCRLAPPQARQGAPP
jgi:hypothetical protein